MGPNRPFLVEEDYFWKVVSEADAVGVGRRIVGMVAPHDTDKFEVPLYDVQSQWRASEPCRSIRDSFSTARWS